MAGASRREWWGKWLHRKTEQGRQALYDAFDGKARVVGHDNKGFVKVRPVKDDGSFGGYSRKELIRMGIVKE